MHSPKLNIQIPLKCTILVYGPIITLGTCIMAVRLILCVCELRVCSSWIQSWQIKSSSHCHSSSLKSLVVDRKSQREEWRKTRAEGPRAGLKPGLLHFSLPTQVVGVFHATETPATTCHMVGDETSSIIV